jgi:zinc transport system ATP-binding protein
MSVLEDVNLRLEEGGFLGLIGPNGGGKTVLLKVILGLLRPDRGSVSIFGAPPGATRGLVSYVPQHARFDPTFPISVRDVVLMGRAASARLARRYTAHDRERAAQALSRMRLEAVADRQVGRLSGGEAQRTLIARALATDARLLLLDEPTANLDARMEREFYEVVAALPPAVTLILVSHDVGVMHQHVKTVACLNRRLFYHHSREITQEMIEEAYGCPVDIIVHRHTHRVLDAKTDEEAG